MKDLIEARMRGLAKDERAILDVGAVCGMTFEPGLVASVLEEKPVRVLRDLADIERRHGLVQGEAGRTRFDQNQIQEVLYQSLPPDLRAEYHMLIAAAFEGDDPVFLAHHHLRGSRPQEARPHLEPALDQLEKSYRNEALLDLASRALDIDGLLAGKERVEVLLRKVDRLHRLGRSDDAQANPDEAAAAADETGDPTLRSKAQRLLGGIRFLAGEIDAGEEATRAALELARSAGDKKLEAQAPGISLGFILHNSDRVCGGSGALTNAPPLLSSEIGDRGWRGRSFRRQPRGRVLGARATTRRRESTSSAPRASAREIGESHS